MQELNAAQMEAVTTTPETMEKTPMETEDPSLEETAMEEVHPAMAQAPA